MANLSTIRPNKGSLTRKTRLARGRGSGVGGTSGRGMNWQNSRTGKGKRYPTFEWGQTRLFMRTPKKRGFTAFRPEEFAIVNLSTLEKLAQEGVTTIDYAVLYERRIIRKKGKFLKILGNGKLSSAVTVTADAASQSVKDAIAAVGGTLTLE